MSSSESYGAAVAGAQQAIRQAALNDPNSHFPYKHDAVIALLEENPPAGKDANDDSKRVSDYMTVRIADASKAYVEAQAAHLENPGDATKAAYEQAAEDLVWARQIQRRGRGGEMAVAGQEN